MKKLPYRIGQGLDAHRIAPSPGASLVLGGVQIPCDLRIEAHSDGDLLLHALCDAILGALALGDIGQHFPPSDPRWRDHDSTHFVTEALRLCRQQGYKPVQTDITMIGERPKLAPHRESIRESIAKLLQLPRECVSVKATTTEGMGFTGRGEGLMASATVLLAIEEGCE